MQSVRALANGTALREGKQTKTNLPKKSTASNMVTDREHNETIK